MIFTSMKWNRPTNNCCSARHLACTRHLFSRLCSARSTINHPNVTTIVLCFNYLLTDPQALLHECIAGSWGRTESPEYECAWSLHIQSLSGSAPWNSPALMQCYLEKQRQTDTRKNSITWISSFINHLTIKWLMLTGRWLPVLIYKWHSYIWKYKFCSDYICVSTNESTKKMLQWFIVHVSNYSLMYRYKKWTGFYIVTNTLYLT